MKNIVLSFILVMITISFFHVDAKVSSLNTAKMEKLAYEMVNKERKEKGLHELNYSQELRKRKRRRQRRCLEPFTSVFSHERFCFSICERAR